MKTIKNLSSLIFILFIAFSCVTDEDILYSLEYIPAPANLSVTFDVSQDNTGSVTIIPVADGAQKYIVTFGDVPGETPTEYAPNQLITHIYPEGVYTVKIVAVGITGLETVYTQQLTVSLKAPENLVIDIENDLLISKKVNISAMADYATVINFYFGDAIGEEPTLAAPGEKISHDYTNAGDYIIRVVAKGAAIAVLDTSFTFTVTEILAPLEAAPEPPARAAANVISIFSGAYTNLAGTDFNPNWGQSTISTIVDIAGNPTIKYANLNYQGTQFGSTIDASTMTYLHIDLWTLDATNVSVYPISIGTGEKSVDLSVVAGEWKSYDIPLTDFISQGLSMADLHQFKFVGTNGSTIFMDNIYFYKESSAPVVPSLPLDFESGTIVYAFTNFDGGVATVIDNSHPSGINTSAKTGQMVKNAGQPWGGSWIAMDNPIDFSAKKTFKMKVYSPRVGAKVLLKVENMTSGGINFEKEVETLSANAWEELTFDYSAINTSNSYQKIVLIFDLGTVGDGSPNFTFLFDDIELTN